MTLIELLIKPMRAQEHALARRYREILLQQPHLRMVEIGQAIAEEAARIRAKHDFKTPDAIQLATALLQGADAFLTNDRALRSFPGIPVVVLNDHLERR